MTNLIADRSADIVLVAARIDLRDQLVRRIMSIDNEHLPRRIQLGVELGGSLKNVIALAAGTADGLGYGDNTKAALITRGIAEIARLGTKMGAHMETFYGLSGMGDLIVTCASVHSRNRKAGYLMGKGYTMQQAMNEVKMVVEGVYSAKAAKSLAEKYDVEMPIIMEVNKVLFEDKSSSGCGA